MKHKLSSLESLGHKLYYEGRPTEASAYYAAIVQLLSGTSDKAHALLRQKCILQLAVCAYADQQYCHAIARSSEVLDELPEADLRHNFEHSYSVADLFDSVDQDRSTAYCLGFARLIRAKCFIALHMIDLAREDLLAAQVHLPDETEVYSLLHKLGEVERTNTSASSQLVDAASPALEISSSDATARRVKFVENCILNHPSALLSQSQIRRLLRTRRTAEAPVALRLFGPAAERAGGKADLQEMLFYAGPSVLGALGMDAGSSSNAMQVLRALGESWRLGRMALRLLRRHRDGAVLGLTALWTAVCAASCAKLLSTC